MPPELECTELPQSMAYLWEYFVDIRNSGEVNYTTIKSYSELMCCDFKPSEVRTIMDFEKAYRRAS